jgi:ubiquitin-conjugating enzyme E2 D/E
MINQQKLKAMKQLKREFDALQNNPITSLGVTVGLTNPNNIFQWKITMIGPQDTPYGGGLFFLEANFPDDYPKNGPKVRFLTKIFHCNVFNWGICISTLNHWKPTPMEKVLSDIFALFYANNPDNHEQPSREYRSNRALFEQHCREWVQKYAKP